MKSAHIAVYEDGAAGTTSTDCVLGRDVKIEHQALAQWSFRDLEQVDLDLLFLAGVVLYIDRRIRRPNKRGTRVISVDMPVADQDRWAANAARSSLEEALHFLTGDRWSFSFRLRSYSVQTHLALRPMLEGPLVTIPYSGGLDSFAALQLAYHDREKVPLVVTTGLSDNGIVARRTIDPWLSSYHSVAMPVSFSIREHLEPSGRARTFLFFAVAALAAKLAGAQEIVVPENGQGSVGVSALPWADEIPPRGSHPGFTQRLQRFLSRLWGNAPRYIHPYLWYTKTDVLRLLVEKGLTAGWHRSLTCARNPQRNKGGSRVPPQCGICCGCILRRMSLLTAGVDGAAAEAYLYGDLSARSIEESINPLLRPVRTTPHDIEIATSAVWQHQEMANAASLPDNNPVLLLAASDIARALQMPQVDAMVGLRRLLHHHEADWSAFLASISEQSWLRQLAGGR